MAASKVKEARSNAARAKILEAAGRLFAENGYVETTTLAIAREAGVNETSLFRNFGSKKNLFQELFGPESLETDRAALRALPSGGEPRGDLKRVFLEYLRICVRRIPNYVLSVQQIDEVFDPAFYQSSVDAIDNMSAHMVDCLEGLRDQGGLREFDYRALSEYLFSLFLIKAPQFALEAQSPSELEKSLDRAADEYVDFVCALAEEGGARP